MRTWRTGSSTFLQFFVCLNDEGYPSIIKHRLLENHNLHKIDAIIDAFSFKHPFALRCPIAMFEYQTTPMQLAPTILDNINQHNKNVHCMTLVMLHFEVHRPEKRWVYPVPWVLHPVPCWIILNHHVSQFRWFSEPWQPIWDDQSGRLWSCPSKNDNLGCYHVHKQAQESYQVDHIHVNKTSHHTFLSHYSFFWRTHWKLSIF